MATFYLEVTSGGDVLAVDASTALAYQTGSVEDTGTLVTITPTLEAVSFDLPSDIDIFYKDVTSSTWLPSNAAGRTFEVSLADGVYTYEAQLRYDEATPVTDENGAQVAVQSTTFTVGAAAPADDWDTNADGVYTAASANMSTSFDSYATTVASVSYQDMDEGRINGGQQQISRASGGWLSNPGPYAAIYANWEGSVPGFGWRMFEWNGLTNFSTRHTLVAGQNAGYSDADSCVNGTQVTIAWYPASEDVTGWSAPS